MKIYLVTDKAAFDQLILQEQDALNLVAAKENDLFERFKAEGDLYSEGSCWPLQKKSKFLVDDQYTQSDQINWRERLVCQSTKMNNRQRGAIHVFEQLTAVQRTSKIYLTEQHTFLYRWFRKKYKNSTGSEYLTQSNGLSLLKFRLKLFPEKLNHQDLTQLEYPDQTFDHSISLDCLEHIPEYRYALTELFRVIKADGMLFLSVPFDLSADETLVRATVDEAGEITHLLEPEYHGNPVSKQGSLSFYTFGWDLLDELKEAGFKESFVAVYWSIKYMYLGGPQIIICAKK